MRVLMLSKACLVGIYQRKLELIAAHPAISALCVLVPPSWKDERGETQLERAHTTGYQLAVTPIRLNGNFHLHYYPEFAREAQAFQPDLIHIDEEPYNLATWLALRTAQRLKAKSLFFSWQNIQRRYPPPFNWLERWVLDHVDYALMGTESAAEVWRAKGYQKDLAIIPQFGVDANLFIPSPRPSSEQVHIGYIGRLVPEKGVDLLLEALASLKNLPWHLHLIGGGPARESLQHQSEHLGLSERLTFVGQVASLNIPPYYQKLDILALPSRTLPNWKEQFGRVIIEAMASGVNVIGSDSGAIPDVIGDAGLIFPEDNAAALAEHLRHLILNPAARQTLAQKGRAHILANFTQAQIAAQTVAAYQQILDA